jgi:hypothetical protein
MIYFKLLKMKKVFLRVLRLMVHGVCQHSCRFFHAAFFKFSVLILSGFKVTGPATDQLRVSPDQRSGLRSFACL